MTYDLTSRGIEKSLVMHFALVRYNLGLKIFSKSDIFKWL